MAQKMDAQINQINVKPAKLDKDNIEVHPQYATLSLNIPMDSLTQRESVKALLDVMEKEWVKVEVIPDQLRFETETSNAAAD